MSQQQWERRVERDLDLIIDWVWRFPHVHSVSDAQKRIRMLLRDLIKDVQKDAVGGLPLQQPDTR